MRRQIRQFVLTTAVLGLTAVASVAAGADVDLTFNAVGTFTDGATLGGSLTLDTTNGSITLVALMTNVPGFTDITFDSVSSATPNSPVTGLYTYQFGSTTLPGPSLFISIPTSADNLEGYAGGSLASLMNPVDGYTSYLFLKGAEPLVDGALLAPVPEPSTLFLECLGGVCAVAYGVADKRRAARRTPRGA